MNPRMIAAQDLLDAAVRTLQESAQPTPHTYPALFAEEFRKEINKVGAMLRQPATFESKLKERCSIRSHRDLKYGSIRYFLDTPSNLLYWDLASIMFKPTNLREMFSIMLPDIKYQIIVRDFLTNDHSQAGIEFQLVRQSLDNLNEELPNFNSLAHYVITTDCVFDMRQVDHYNHEQLTKLGDLLKIEHPDIHNSMIEQQAIKQLKLNMSKMHTALTPREALKELSRQLELAAPASTGKKCSDLAGDQAFVGLATFADFRELLSEAELHNLDKMYIHSSLLSGNTTWFGNYLNDVVFKGNETVDVIARTLQNFLHNHPAPHAVLDRQVTLSNKEITNETKPAEKRIAILGSQPDMMVYTPIDFLTSHLFSKLDNRQNHNTLYDLMRHTPSTLYQLLIGKHQNIDTSYFLKMIEHQILTQEQIKALLRTLTRTRKLSDLLIWALHNKQDDALEVILDCHDNALELAAALRGRFHPNDNLLANCHTARQARLILLKLPENLRYELIALNRFNPASAEIHAAIVGSITDHQAFSSYFSTRYRVLDNIELINLYAGINIQLAFALVEKAVDETRNIYGMDLLMLPAGEWLRYLNNVDVIQHAVEHAAPGKNETSFLLTPDENNETILHISTSHEVMSYYVSKIRKKYRQSTLTTHNDRGIFPLSRSDISHETFKCMLMSIPKRQRYYAVTTSCGRNPGVIYDTLGHLDRLPMILAAIEPSTRCSALIKPYQRPDSYRQTSLMYRILNNKDPGFLREILLLIPAEDRLRALIGDSNIPGMFNTIDLLSKDFDSLKIATELLPETDAEKLLTTLHDGNPIGGSIAFCKEPSQDMKQFFLLMPASCLTRLLTHLQYANGNLMTRFIAIGIDFSRMILARLPQEIRLSILEQCPLISLELMPAEYRVTALLKQKENSRNAIENAVISKADNIGELLNCLTFLSETESHALLLTKADGQTLLDKISNKLCHIISLNCYDKYNFNTWYKHYLSNLKSTPTFIHDFVIIYAFLQAESNRLYQHEAVFTRLFSHNIASKLLCEINRCRSVDEIKQTLMSQLETPFSTFGRHFATLLGKHESLETRVQNIRNRWQMSMCEMGLRK